MTSPLQASDITAIELQRRRRQALLDGERSALERNQWGQFATPPELARDIVNYALTLHGNGPIRFLEPSCGSGSFYSALLSSDRVINNIESADGIELDPRFAATAKELWGPSGLEVTQGDYLDPRTRADKTATLLVANPPYVRHHHLSSTAKAQAVDMCMKATGIRPSGLSGLYLYFVLLSHSTLEHNSVSAWLIPAEFMDVNYGKQLKEYLATRVTLRRVHRFDPADLQFDDALVTSAVVVFENRPPQAEELVDFTYGGSVTTPREHHTSRVADLRPDRKWSAMYRAEENTTGPKLSDFFKIRRGIATGSSKFFVMTVDEATRRGFRASNLTPILPSPRYIKGDVIEVDPNGFAATNPQLVVIDTDATPSELAESDPGLWGYLQTAPKEVLAGYLVKQRRPWYRQEQREPSPILLTYMGRGLELDKPFRFIRNNSRAIATNMFLMLYPTPRLQRYLDTDSQGLDKVHRALLSITGEDLRNGGRVYGGGLHKMEPKELAALSASAVVELCPEMLNAQHDELPLGFL